MRLRPLWSIGLAFSLLASTPFAHADRFSKPSISAPSRSISKPESSKPATPSYTRQEFSKPPVGKSETTQTFSKPGQSQQSTAAPRSSVDAAIAKGQSKQSYQQFQAEQQKYRAPPAMAPDTSAAARNTTAWRQYGTRWHSADAYYADRERALRSVPPSVRMEYEHPPAYVLAGRPSYGAYAAAFLGGALLNHITEQSYANWAYSHYGDPGFQAWRADMDREAVNNAELRDKLAQLDNQVQQLKAANAPVTETLPEGVDPSLVVAPQTALLATSQSSSWLWIIIIILSSVVVFFSACVFISRKRSRGI